MKIRIGDMAGSPAYWWSGVLSLSLLAFSAGVHAVGGDDKVYENTQNEEDPYPIDGPADIMPLAANEILLDIDKVGNKYVAVGVRGHVLISNDAVNWTQSQVPTRSALTAVAFVDENNGNAVGHDAVILRTTDGGVTWEKQLYAPELERPFLDVQFFDGGNGLAIGAYGLMYETADGGASWTESEAAIREDEWHFNALVQLNDGSLLLPGEVGNLSHSRDGGKTWARVESPYDGSFFGALPYKERGAVIFGLRGNAFMIDDINQARGKNYGGIEEDLTPGMDMAVDASGEPVADEDSAGATGEEDTAEAEPEFVPSADAWKRIDTKTILGLLGGAALPNGDIVLVGANGKILRSSGSPGNLKDIANPVGKNLADVIVIGGGDQLLMAGENGAQLIDAD